MNDFTFVMITYNQEQYVIQHFKSIIYQIKNYGSNIRNNIIIADDCSNDNTITILKKLIDEYRTYIHSFTIIVQDHNVGIVNNHIYKHTYMPEYTCSEENICTNINDNCSNNF